MGKTKTKKSTQSIRLEFQEDGLAILTIDLPDKKLNVLSKNVFEELNEKLEEIKEGGDSRALVIESGKKGSFVAGADINDLAQITDADEGAEMSA